MAIRARILTKIELPEVVEIEIDDTIRGEKTVRQVDFSGCLQELAQLGTIDLHDRDAAELITLASALAKHRAIDQYLLGLGIDPHQHLQDMDTAV